MYPIILPIYGPISLNSFSLAIAIGIAIFIWQACKDPIRAKIISKDLFLDLCIKGTIFALIGGRILFVLEEWHNFQNYWQMLAIWNKGLSSLGCVIFGSLYFLYFCLKNKLNILKIGDLICLYAPIIHIFTRIGCFLAGCCFGKPTDLAWGIIYKNPESIAPLNIKLHPTQLYSVLIYLFIFCLLKLISKRNYITGQILFLYLILSNSERLLLDFLRGDRIINSNNSIIKTEFLSVDQYISVFIIIFSLICLRYIYKKNSLKKPVYESI